MLAIRLRFAVISLCSRLRGAINLKACFTVHHMDRLAMHSRGLSSESSSDFFLRAMRACTILL